MGVGPIPYSSVVRYAEGHDMDPDEFDYFHGIIRAMDNEYLTIVNKPKDDANMVSITDIEGQHEMFARMRMRAQGKRK